MACAYITDLEQRLVRCAKAGELLDLAPDETITHEEMDDWGKDRHIRADVLRDLLLGRLTEALDPRGVRARGVVVEGRLDVSKATVPVGLELTDSRLADGLHAEAARLPYLDLRRCVSRSDQHSTTGLVHGIRMDLNPAGAQIDGQLDLGGSGGSGRTPKRLGLAHLLERAETGAVSLL